MKYIYNRNQHKIQIENKYLTAINELVDSKDVNPEFGETLIGGTLHRLLGFVRAKKNQATILTYATQLDRLLASMIMVEINKELDEDVADDENINDDNDDGNQEEELVQGIRQIATSQIILYAGELQLDGKEEEAKQALLQLPYDDIQLMPESAQEMVNSIIGDEDEDEDEETKSEEEEIETEDETVDGDENVSGSIESEGEKNKELESDTVNDADSDADADADNDSDKINYEGTEEEKKKEQENKEKAKEHETEYKKKFKVVSDRLSEHEKMLNEISSNYRNRVNRMKDTKQKERFNKYLSLLGQYLGQIKRDLAKSDLDLSGLESLNSGLNETEVYFKKLKGIISSSESVDSNIKEGLMILEKLVNVINESKGAVNNLTQRGFNRVRREIERASKDWPVTREKLEKINKIAEEEKVEVTEITARQGKELMAILNRAKNSMIHTKPYDEIRKNQKRWYDKLSSGRAIERKGYQTWAKRVTEISSYYKQQVPDKVIVAITDSLDKENISNDYVTLTQEFLGLNVRGRKPSGDTEKMAEYVTGYSVGDTVEYEMANNRNMNTGVVVAIGKSDVEVRTKKGVFVILKKRIKSFKRK